MYSGFFAVFQRNVKIPTKHIPPHAAYSRLRKLPFRNEGWPHLASEQVCIETLSRDDGAFEYELCSHLEDKKLSNQKKLLVPMFLFFAVGKDDLHNHSHMTAQLRFLYFAVPLKQSLLGKPRQQQCREETHLWLGFFFGGWSSRYYITWFRGPF